MLTALLSRADVSRHLRALHLLETVKRALGRPLGGGVRVEGERTHAWLDGLELRLEAMGAEGHRTWDLVGPDGRRRARLDAANAQPLGTAVLAAFAADRLAPPEAAHVAVLGDGPLRSTVLKSLRLVRSLKRVWWWEPSFPNAIELAMKLQLELALPVEPVETGDAAILDAELVVLGDHAPLPERTLLAPRVVLAPRAEPPFAPGGAHRFCELPARAPAWFQPCDGLEAAPRPGARVWLGSADPRLELLVAHHVWETARDDESIPLQALDA